MNTTQKQLLVRAASQIGTTPDKLDAEIVELMFGRSKKPLIVYSNLVKYKRLANAGKRSGVSLQQMLALLDAIEASGSDFESVLTQIQGGY